MKLSKPQFHVLSLGAGVQSSTLAVLYAQKILTPMPDCGIFADAHEPDHVYRWLEYLEKKLPFPIHRVRKGEGLKADLNKAIDSGCRVASVPVFTSTQGKQGKLWRQCTMEYKITPIIKKIRELMGIKRIKRGTEILCVQYIGISTDEAARMKPSRESWIENKWPLIDLGMSRQDCIDFMLKSGFPMPPKSSCTFCPYHDDWHWKAMKEHDPKSFAEAVDMDNRIRNGYGKVKQTCFLHRSMIPLKDVDFDERIKSSKKQKPTNHFINECQGMCGV